MTGMIEGFFLGLKFPISGFLSGRKILASIFLGGIFLAREFFGCSKQSRGGEWYLEKRGSWKILAGSRNVGNVFDKSQSIVFFMVFFYFF